ncbi:MAG: universal stress protein [Proteobacteria bacterium]|nr:universal stress protein [Pseudomonadota bacterium]
MIESLLVATDGSEAASAAERVSISLASKLSLRVSGYTVLEDKSIKAPGHDGLSLPAFPESAVADYYKARAEAIARRFGERARGEGVEASCEVGQGVADDRIVEKGQGFDLAALGREGQSAAYHTALIGSTVEGVMRKTSRSTLIVPAGAALTGPIVLAFDGSPGSRIAANLAVALANGLSEKLHVFVDSKDKGRAVARFDEVRQLVGGANVPVQETSSTLGRPDVKIVDTARETRAGLIVMGAFGRNRITDYFLGSNAAAVARTAPVPVLLTR